PESLGQRICRLEANAMDIEGQSIGILPHLHNGVIAVGLVNPDSSGRSNAMRVQEDHDLADDFLGFPGLDDSLFAFGTNAVEVGQTLRGLLNDIKHLLAKGLDQLFGKVRPDAFDHPRAEILFDAFQRTRWDDPERLRLKLQPVRPIVHPDALPLNVLARGDRRRHADDSDQIAVTTDLDPEDADAGLFSMERHTLHGTGQLFHRMHRR